MATALPIVLSSTGDRLRHNIAVRQFQLTVDEPTDLGGTDAGPTPSELVFSGLASCKAITLKMYADRKGWPLEAVDAEVEVAKLAQRYEILVRLRLTGNLDESQKERLLEISNKCPVHKLLAPGADIKTVIAGKFR